jgi:hypothetical protein
MVVQCGGHGSGRPQVGVVILTVIGVGTGELEAAESPIALTKPNARAEAAKTGAKRMDSLLGRGRTLRPPSRPIQAALDTEVVKEYRPAVARRG